MFQAQLWCTAFSLHELANLNNGHIATYTSNATKLLASHKPVYSYFELVRSTRSVKAMPVTADIHARKSSENNFLQTHYIHLPKIEKKKTMEYGD